MTNPKGAFLDEQAAVDAVLAAIEDGLQRMHAIADRILVRRGLTAKDRRFLAEMEAALVQLADELATRSVYGDRYGELLKAAFKKGVAAAGPGAMINVNPETIEAALWPARLEIKGLLEDGSRAITELTARGMVAGWSPRELSQRIQEEVVLYREDGTAYGVPEWRAELQARNEPMKVFRAAGSQDWTPDTLLEQIGPDDARTAGDICSTYLGKVMTLAKWEAKGCDPRGYGWHPNCRHKWIKAQAAEAGGA
jgi:hypothetical protein